MQLPRYRIMCREPNGAEFEAFTWTRTAESGVARAHADSIRFERPIVEAWAVPITEESV